MRGIKYAFYVFGAGAGIEPTSAPGQQHPLNQRRCTTEPPREGLLEQDTIKRVASENYRSHDDDPQGEPGIFCPPGSHLQSPLPLSLGISVGHLSFNHSAQTSSVKIASFQ